MNNEEYLKDIIREAVEDVLYEFKDDIKYETKAKLLKDYYSGDHDPKKRNSVNTDPFDYDVNYITWRPRTAQEKRNHDKINWSRSDDVSSKIDRRERTRERRKSGKERRDPISGDWNYYA